MDKQAKNAGLSAQEEFWDACLEGDARRALDCLERGADAWHSESLGLRLAAQAGRAEVLSVLAGRCDPAARQSEALADACMMGHAASVACLVKAPAHPEGFARGFLAAAAAGSGEVLELMIPQASEPLLGEAARQARQAGMRQAAGILGAALRSRQEKQELQAAAPEHGDAPCGAQRKGARI